ncbi:MAG: hydroxyacid dehydrogenase [Chitinophagales bacterium]|nr:hydroxyacid dehydrogenase [Chitinophagales bacterium]MDW8418415.1 NAD(P)-dependent oxidoreductase [Chitinophagales bacterium]
MRRILLTDHFHPILRDGLIANGFLVDERPDITQPEVMDVIHHYEGLVINSKIFAGEALFSRAPQLRFVCRAGSGLEVIDRDAAQRRGIAFFNSPEGNRQAVGEHALALLLNLLRHVTRAYMQIQNNEWVREENRGVELRGKTIALLGYGNTGQAFARVLAGFDVCVLAYDKYKQGFSNLTALEATLPMIFETADILSIHLPLTEETRYMVNAAFLRNFKKPIWVINTARGKNLHTGDLLTALNEGRVVGAALDVLENENLQALTESERVTFDLLKNHPRVLLTPHIAGWTHESKCKIAEVLLEKILQFYNRGQHDILKH